VAHDPKKPYDKSVTGTLKSLLVFEAAETAPKSALEKFLSLFADVRSGEGLGVVLMTLNAFLLLASYYLIKTAREALILTEGGAEIKTYSAAGQALVLLLLVPLYGWCGTKVNRVKLVAGLTLFFVTHLLMFSFFGSQGVREGIVYYIWVGIFSVFVVSQFWAFANDLYSEGQGRRLFPLIGVGSSVGALAGAKAAGVLVDSFSLSPYALMLVAAAILSTTAALVAWANSLEARKGPKAIVKESEEVLSKEGGFSLVLQDKYLLWIALLTVLLNIVNTSGEYMLSRLVTDEAAKLKLTGPAKAQFIGGFYATYFSWVNGIGLLVQAFGVSRIFKHAGIRGSLFFLPVISLMSYSVLAVAPILAIVRGVKTLENSADYSVQNTVKQALWLPTSREAKYKAKAAIDTFCMRFGDMLAAAIVFLGTTVAALTVTQFAWVNVILVIVWLWVAGRIAKEHAKRSA
jgi:ATP:ADP antiporter, AAA family